MIQRGRPKLTDEERKRRKLICCAWADEIKRNSGLSARSLAKALAYGSGYDAADGRAWRALASGDRAPSLESFKRMTVQAAESGWLDPFGYLRYKNYWEPHSETGDGFFTDGELRWRLETLNNALLMLMAHARKCGVSQDRFFADVRAEVDRGEMFMRDLADIEIEQRACKVAITTTQNLLDGPEYPSTSLSLSK